MVCSENVCRFTGILISYEAKLVGNDGYLLGSAQLFLPDSETQKGPKIKLVAWGDTAERLGEVPLNSWIEVVTCYTPDWFGNKLYDNFTIGAFSIKNA